MFTCFEYPISDGLTVISCESLKLSESQNGDYCRFARHQRLMAETLVRRFGGKAASTSLMISVKVHVLIRARMKASSSGSDKMRDGRPLRCARRCAALVSTAVKGVFKAPLTASSRAVSSVVMVRELAARRSSIWQADWRARVMAVRTKPASILSVAGLRFVSVIAIFTQAGATR